MFLQLGPRCLPCAGWTREDPLMRRFAGSDGLALVVCVECGLEADERFTAAQQWAWWATGEGKLVPYCPACAEREFGRRVTRASRVSSLVER
jgi:hypothetical protein